MNSMFEIRRAPLSWHNYLARVLGTEVAEKISARAPGVYVCGGAIRGYFLGEQPSDVDVFVHDEFVAAGVHAALSELGLSQVFETETDVWRTVTYRAPTGTPLQVIMSKRPLLGGLEGILEAFDFTICQAGYDCVTESFRLHPDFFEHLACKNLVYTGSEFSLSSLRRAFKFQRRGFLLCDEMLIQIVRDAARINFDDPAEMARHVAGMDPDGARRIRPID